MRKRLRLKKMVSALLAVAMIGQSCLVTTAGDLTDDAAIVAMQEQAAAEEAAEEAAAQKAAEDAAAQKAAEDAAAQKAAEEKAAQEITYRVTFEAHAADYGSIYVRGESGPIASVSSYYKEVKENGSFAFTIHANDGYEVEHVRYADTNAELPKNAQGAYEIAAVTRNVKVVVTYKIVPQETADAAVETEADEGQTEAPTDESETEEDREAETEVGTENATENVTEESTEAESEYETEPGTEAESETESESEEEILMPEFHYNGVCNGIAVAIQAPEGVFPEGTKAVLATVGREPCSGGSGVRSECIRSDGCGYHIPI